MLVKILSEYFWGVEKKWVILKIMEFVFVVYEEDIYYCCFEGYYIIFYMC